MAVNHLCALRLGNHRRSHWQRVRLFPRRQPAPWLHEDDSQVRHQVERPLLLAALLWQVRHVRHRFVPRRPLEKDRKNVNRCSEKGLFEQNSQIDVEKLK